MMINNKEYSSRVRFSFMVVVIVYVTLLVLSIVFHWFKTNTFNVVISVVFFSGLVYFFIRGYNYIYFNPDGSKIILRYVPLQPMLYGTYSIEIPHKDFVKYEIIKSHFGLRTSVVLFQRTDRGLSKYKPVSLTSLTKAERRDLIETLDKLLP